MDSKMACRSKIGESYFDFFKKRASDTISTYLSGDSTSNPIPKAYSPSKTSALTQQLPKKSYLLEESLSILKSIQKKIPILKITTSRDSLVNGLLEIEKACKKLLKNTENNLVSVHSTTAKVESLFQNVHDENLHLKKLLETEQSAVLNEFKKKMRTKKNLWKQKTRLLIARAEKAESQIAVLQSREHSLSQTIDLPRDEHNGHPNKENRLLTKTRASSSCFQQSHEEVDQLQSLVMAKDNEINSIWEVLREVAAESLDLNELRSLVIIRNLEKKVQLKTRMINL